jgi:hypothetical protein
MSKPLQDAADEANERLREAAEHLIPTAVADEGKSDRIGPALWLGARVRRYRTLVRHPLFNEIYGRLVAGESPMRVANWLQSAVPPDDIFGVESIKYLSLTRRLYRFRDALPPAVLLGRSYIDEMYQSAEASVDVLNEFDTLIRLQKERISAFAQKEKDFPVPLEQVRREIATLGELLERRRETAIAFGFHGASHTVVMGNQIMQVAVQAGAQPSAAGRKYAEIMQDQPEKVADMTELFDRLQQVMAREDEAVVIDGVAALVDDIK